MTNPTPSNWSDLINALPTRSERAVLRTEWLAKFKAFIETNPLTPGTILDWLRESGLLLNRNRTPRFENRHYENQAGVNGAISVAVAIANPLVETPLSVPDQRSFMESNLHLGNGLADFNFNFDDWRRSERNEIPRQVLRTELDYEMQNLIQAMGSFRPHREDRIVIDDPVGPCKPHMDVLNLFGHA